MSLQQTKNITDTTREIIRIVHEDDMLNHCRINIINGVKNVFTKYKASLSQIEEGDCISVKCYSNHNTLHNDLFVDQEFMEKDWFNLFVFNIGKNGKTVGEEIRGVELIAMELRSKFDAKFFSTLIVSEMDNKELAQAFEDETGQMCPVVNKRYLDYNFNGIVILDYLKKILHTHSTEFLSRWSYALDKLEKMQKSTNLSQV